MSPAQAPLPRRFPEERPGTTTTKSLAGHPSSTYYDRARSCSHTLQASPESTENMQEKAPQVNYRGGVKLPLRPTTPPAGPPSPPPPRAPSAGYGRRRRAASERWWRWPSAPSCSAASPRPPRWRGLRLPLAGGAAPPPRTWPRAAAGAGLPQRGGPGREARLRGRRLWGSASPPPRLCAGSCAKVPDFFVWGETGEGRRGTPSQMNLSLGCWGPNAGWHSLSSREFWVLGVQRGEEGFERRPRRVHVSLSHIPDSGKWEWDITEATGGHSIPFSSTHLWVLQPEFYIKARCRPLLLSIAAIPEPPRLVSLLAVLREQVPEWYESTQTALSERHKPSAAQCMSDSQPWCQRSKEEVSLVRWSQLALSQTAGVGFSHFRCSALPGPGQGNAVTLHRGTQA